jgi:hypothetical protein
MRNQVIHEPNLRPARPHSSRWSSLVGCPHRTAMKPSTVTRANSAVKTAISIHCGFIADHLVF